MKKNTLSQQKFITSATMDRKPTIKKYPDVVTFSIFDNDHQITKIEISPNSTVADLLAEVKQNIGQLGKTFIGLMSRNNNEIIDYTLKMKNFPLSNFPNNMEFEIQHKGETQTDNQPSLNDFQFLKLLGSGVSASVYLVRHKCNGMLYAIKQIKKSYFKQFKRMEQVLRERKIMIEMIIDIPFTTRLIASFQSQKFLNFVIEYYPGGEMFFHLQKRRLSEQEAKLYVAEMVIAFEKLHEKKIIYRDLKPENIMIDFDGHARLGDFGLCKMNLQYYDLTYSYCGSEEYMAPQVKSQNGYNYSVDFYTLGSFAYQLVMGVPPYYNNEQLTFHQNATDQFIQLVTKLIQSNMHRRLKSFNEIRRLKWFKTIQWKKVQEKKYQMPFKLDIQQNYIGEEFKNEVIDHQMFDQQRFDKLLECFFYLSDQKGGISQFYGRKGKKFMEVSQKKKRISFQSSEHNNSRKSSQSKTSQNRSSSKSKSKESNIFKKPTQNNVPGNNIYTTTISNQHLQKQSSKKLFSSGQSSKSKPSRKKLNSSSNSQSRDKTGTSQSKKMKKSQKLQQKPQKQKITMKKVKSSNNMMSWGGNTYNKVVQLRNVFSPTRKVVSPNKSRPTPLGI